jgi:hypothetical protein
MALQYKSGQVGGLFSNSFGDWVLVAGQWYKTQPGSSMLTVAAEAKAAGTKVYIGYNTTDSTLFEIYTF